MSNRFVRIVEWEKEPNYGILILSSLYLIISFPLLSYVMKSNLTIAIIFLTCFFIFSCMFCASLGRGSHVMWKKVKK